MGGIIYWVNSVSSKFMVSKVPQSGRPEEI